MKWFKRCFWLAAWGTWVCVGVGLAHQLPRTFGRPLAKLPDNDAAIRLGFVGATDTYAIQALHRDAVIIQLVEARTGRDLGNRPLPKFDHPFMGANYPPAEHFKATLRHGVLFGVGLERPPGDRSRSREGMQGLEVLGGEWRQLSTRPTIFMVPHPEMPWVALLEGESPAKAEALAVVDWKTGKELFRHPIPTGVTVSDRPFFVPSRDAVVLPLLFPPDEGQKKRKGKLEVWKLADPPVLEETVDGPASTEGSLKFSVSPKGRLFWDTQLYWADAYGMSDVYDFNERRFYSSIPTAERLPGGKRGWGFSTARQSISPSGRALFRYSSPDVVATIYEIDTANILWRAGPHETPTELSSQEGLIVEETWHELWKKWLPNLKFETIAWRSLDSGDVICRTAVKTVIDPKHCNVNRTLFVAADGSVYRLPLPVNWRLLAYCQAILALPLVLLWAILGWRRRRRNRATALKSSL